MKFLRKILAGWNGIRMDASYWLYVIRLEDEHLLDTSWDQFLDDHQDFWVHLGAWLDDDETQEKYPTPWDQFLFDSMMDEPLTEEEHELVDQLWEAA